MSRRRLSFAVGWNLGNPFTLGGSKFLKAAFPLCFQLRCALDKTEELEVSNGHLVKRLEKMKANRSALLSQQ